MSTFSPLLFRSTDPGAPTVSGSVGALLNLSLIHI